jgi:ADP-L-glycero-D-manno-heptose 6-epimerase
MKFLITGSRGFIGQNLINHLSRKHDIIKYDILDGYCRPDKLPVNEVDWVIHLGAVSSTTETNIEKVMDLNVSWSVELFESCIKHDVNFQWSSSASVYGNSTTFAENQPMKPLNLYARSKMLLETYIKDRAPNEITWQGFRYFNVYGKHEDHKGKQASPYHQFTMQAKETGIVLLFEGSDNFSRDFVPVELVCDYHERFLTCKKSGVFNIGTGKNTSFAEVAHTVAKMHSARVVEIPFPEHLKTHYQAYTCADMSLTKSVLN